MKQILKCIGWVALNFGIQLIVQIVLAIPAAASGMNDAELNNYIMDNILLMTLISNIVFVGIILLVALIKKENLIAKWRINKPALKAMAMPLISALLFSTGFAFATYNTTDGNSVAIQNSADYFSEKMPFLGLILMVVNLLVLAPISEEMLCRGIMINGLNKRFSLKIAVIASSLIFGAMHIMAGGPILVVGCVVMGLIFGITYVKTGSLTAAVAVHSAANIPDFIFMAFPPADGVLKYVFAGAFIIASAGCVAVWLRKEK